MDLDLFLALRALLRSRLSLVLLVLAVAAGVAFQIPNAANLNGYTEELLRQGVLRATGHVLITPRGPEPLQDAGRLDRRVAAQPGVRAVTVQAIHAGVLFKGEAYQAVQVFGVDPERERAAAGFCARLRGGRCIRGEREGETVVGQRLAEQLGVGAGDRVKLVMPREDLGEVKFVSERLRVVGVLGGGGSFRADYGLFLPRRELLRLIQWVDEASQLSVFVDDPAEAERHARRLSRLVPGGRAEPWWRANTFVANAIAGNRTLFAISMVMVIFAVGIPVLALLYIHVLHERRQIAVLAALGFTRGALFVIYLLRAALVGLFGVALGVGGGLALCALFDAHPIFSYQGFVVRPVLDLAVVALPAGVLFAVTLVAGVAPAIRAARANPALELREGG
jgi:lipoprotein-releasing system permease protein